MAATVSRPTISAVALETTDVSAAEEFYAALGLADRVQVREHDAPTSGFRGFTLSLVAAQPADVDAYVRAALDAGATLVKPAKKSFWGYGGTLRAPDGTVWTVATSAKKDTGPAALEHDDLVLLLGVDDVKATKRFYVDQGLEVGKSFGSKYVEFHTPGDGIKLALQSRRAVAKNAGVAAEGSGSHRIAVVSDADAFTDPDGFAWETAPGAGDADGGR